MDSKIKEIVIALIEKDHFNYQDEIKTAEAIATFVKTLENELYEEIIEDDLA